MGKEFQKKKFHIYLNDAKRPYNGKKITALGLGQYICTEMIKNHGGKIEAESQLRKGSEFWLTLPLQ